jgi:hypothetical protein
MLGGSRSNTASIAGYFLVCLMTSSAYRKSPLTKTSVLMVLLAAMSVCPVCINDASVILKLTERERSITGSLLFF